MNSTCAKDRLKDGHDTKEGNKHIIIEKILPSPDTVLTFIIKENIG
jgi:hypothetical protein